MLAQRLDEVIAQVAAAAGPANLAKYTFNLARAFNLFYHRHRILAEEDPTRKASIDRGGGHRPKATDECAGNAGHRRTGRM